METHKHKQYETTKHDNLADSAHEHGRNKAFAHDVEVENADGVTIYYVFTNNSTELAVSYRSSSYDSYSNEYSGNVVIPNSVT